MQQPSDVVVFDHQEVGGIGERNIGIEELSGDVPVRRDDLRACDPLVEVPRDRAHFAVDGEQPIGIASLRG